MIKIEGIDVSAYKIISIQKAHAPDNKSTGSWYNYVIANGNNTIIGYRNGSLHEVKLIANDCVSHLNHKYQSVHSGKTERSSYPMGSVESTPVVSPV